MLHKLNSLHVIKDISENSDILLAVLLGNWPFLYFCFSVAFFIEGSNHTKMGGTGITAKLT